METRLVATPAAAGAARRFITETLMGWDVETVVDDVVLCGSELVTNAILHAGGSLVVRLSMPDGVVLLEVIDEIPMQDSTVQARSDNDDDDARMTGRGLAVLAHLATAWGVDRREMPGVGEGKVVWARLRVAHDDGARTGTAARRSTASRTRPPVRRPRDAELVDVPVRLFLGSEDYLDDVLRELQLAWWAHPADRITARLASRLGTFLARMGPSRAAAAAVARRRLAAGEERVNLLVRVDRGVSVDAEQFLDTMEEIEALAGSGLLLAPPPPAGYADFRRWFVGELVRQRGGEAPLPCPYA